MALLAYDLSALGLLVVDDNQHMRLLLRQVLRSLGIRKVREASDGAGAFSAMRNFPADIIITNWMMTPVDGIEFVRLLRTASDSPNPYAPVLMLSGHTEAFRVVEARDAGVNEYLAKPISATQLYSRLVNVVERPRPFVRCPAFAGPCRRRPGSGSDYSGPERRVPDEIVFDE